MMPPSRLADASGLEKSGSFGWAVLFENHRRASSQRYGEAVALFDLIVPVPERPLRYGFPVEAQMTPAEEPLR